MPGVNALLQVYVVFAFLVQIVLIAHFALRRWAFATAMRFGVFVYGLCVPAAILSVALLAGGQAWYFWLAGVLYTAWAVFGYSVEYIRHISWRSPIRWAVLIPYVVLYLASLMFYWWPLATISRPLWYAYAALFVISTVLNVLSHRGPASLEQPGVPSRTTSHPARGTGVGGR